MRQAERHVLAKLCAVWMAWLLAGCGAEPSRSPATRAEPLAGKDVKTFDLEDTSRCQRSWIYRVRDCELSSEPDGSLLCDVRGSDDAGGGQYGGVRLKTGGLTAVEVEIRLVNLDQVDGLWVTFVDTGSSRESERWHWPGVETQESTFTFRAGQDSPPFIHQVAQGGGMADAVEVFIKLKGLNARAGFVLRSVRYMASGETRAAEVPPVTEPPGRVKAALTGHGVGEFNLRNERKRLPAWVYRVRRCALKQEPDGSLSCKIEGTDDTSGGQYGGLRFLTGPVTGVEFEVSFTHPEQIEIVFVDLRNVRAGAEVERWSWKAPGSGPYSLVFRAGLQSPPFQHLVHHLGLAPDAVDLFVKLKGTNAKAGFTVRKMRVEQ